jgi:hypothetical protein
MGNYGVALYGDANDYYGNAIASGLNGEVQWIFLVDWDGDGTFAYNEGAYLVDVWTKRGERYFVKPGGNGFESPRPGEGTATLIDNTRRFDPDNASGPLYEKIFPGRKFRLMVKDLATGTTYPVMAGFINDIPPITERDKIQLSLRESWSLLDKLVSIQMLYRNSITDAMTALISAAKFPVLFGTSIGSETQQITAFNVDNINALDTLIELGQACLGNVFADNTGKLKFYTRGYSSMPTVAIDQADCLKEIRRAWPWENLRNIIQVIANKKIKKREEPIFQARGIKLASGETKVITVQFQPAIDVRLYSIKANGNIDGSGYNSIQNVSYTLNIYGRSMEITLVHVATGFNVYVDLMVTGRPIEDQPIRITVRNALSEAEYGEMVFKLDNPWMQDLTHASAYATMISNFLDEPQRTVEVEIEQRPALQYSFDLFDKITFTSAKLGINTTYYVGMIEHKWMKDTGQAIVTKLVMHPRLTDASAIENDAEDPDLPYLPEKEDPIDITKNPPAIPAPGGTCLTDPNANANGPFSLTGPFPIDLRSNGTYYKDQGVVDGVYIRPSNFVNKSAIGVTGDWQKYDLTTHNWVGDTSSTNWRLYVDGTEATKRVITDAGSGQRILDITSGGGSEIHNLRFEIDQGGGAVGERYLMGAMAQIFAPSDIAIFLDTELVALTYTETLYAGIAVWYVDRLGGNTTAIAAKLSDLMSETVVVSNTLAIDYYNPSAGSVNFKLQSHGPDERWRTWRIFYNPVPGQPLEPLDIDNVSIAFIEEDDFGLTPWEPISTFSAFDTGTDTYRWYIRGVSLYNVCGKA